MTTDVAVPASSYLGMAGAYGSRIPDPLPSDEPAARSEHRDNRPRRFPDVPGGLRGRPDHLASSGVPELPEGRLLYLGPGEWMHEVGTRSADQVVLRVAAVHPGRPTPDEGMVWLSGHRVTCTSSASTCRKPCVQLLVSVEALWRAVGRR